MNGMKKKCHKMKTIFKMIHMEIAIGTYQRIIMNTMITNRSQGSAKDRV